MNKATLVFLSFNLDYKSNKTSIFFLYVIIISHWRPIKIISTRNFIATLLLQEHFSIYVLGMAKRSVPVVLTNTAFCPIGKIFVSPIYGDTLVSM